MPVLERVLDEPRVARARAVLDIYGAAAGGLLANGLAFSSLFAAIPASLLVVGLAGVISGDPTVRASVVDVLSTAFPPLADLIEGSLDALTAGAAFTSVLGILGLTWTVSQLYGALDVAFARIFSIDPERDIVRRTARGFLVVGILVVAIVGFIVISGISAALDAIGPGLPFVGQISDIAGSLPVLALLSVGATVIVYRVLPPRPPAWRAILVPAVIVGLAIVVLSQIFTFLVPRLVGVAALAGSLASAFVALAWLSFGFQALLYGAAWVRVRDRGVGVDASTGLRGAASTAESGRRGE
jgi:YihY family inner membrane protein